MGICSFFTLSIGGYIRICYANARTHKEQKTDIPCRSKVVVMNPGVQASARGPAVSNGIRNMDKETDK